METQGTVPMSIRIQAKLKEEIKKRAREDNRTTGSICSLSIELIQNLWNEIEEKEGKKLGFVDIRNYINNKVL